MATPRGEARGRASTGKNVQREGSEERDQQSRYQCDSDSPGGHGGLPVERRRLVTETSWRVYRERWPRGPRGGSVPTGTPNHAEKGEKNLRRPAMAVKDWLARLFSG